MCPRCGGRVRPPDLMHTEWRCSSCGSVQPLHVAARVNADVLAAVYEHKRRFDDMDDPGAAMWCPWPLPPQWTVTGVGWAGDDRHAPTATAIAISGPVPFASGPADVVFVAEQPGVGLGAALGGLGALDPGPSLSEHVAQRGPDAKVRVSGHPTPLWTVPCGPDCVVYVGEARANWVYAIAWPPAAGYLLADGISLHDLFEELPNELVYGADSGRLRPSPVDVTHF